jgi:hypothetical protein
MQERPPVIPPGCEDVDGFAKDFKPALDGVQVSSSFEGLVTWPEDSTAETTETRRLGASLLKSRF